MPNSRVKNSPDPVVAQILVTGGAGFIGTHLCRKLQGQGLRVLSLDLREPAVPVPGVKYVRGDVRNPAAVEPCVQGAGAVFHLAATVSVPVCQRDPAESYSHNLTGTLVVLEAIRKAGVAAGRAPGIVFSSSAALYGNSGNDGHALREAEVAGSFLSFYAAQKHASEKAIELYSTFYGIPATIFRFFNVFGPGQDPSSPYSGVITVLMRLAREGKALPMNGGGGQTRDFVSVHDIAAACAATLAVPFGSWSAEPMNLGSGKSITIRQLGEMISRRHGGKPRLVDAPAREGDVLHSEADISRARERLGFAPSISLEEGLAEL